MPDLSPSDAQRLYGRFIRRTDAARRMDRACKLKTAQKYGLRINPRGQNQQTIIFAPYKFSRL